MTEHSGRQEPKLERVELAIDPFIESEETKGDTSWELSEFTRRANVELGKRGIYLALSLEGEALDVEMEQQARRRASDEESINELVLKARKRATVVENSAARMIAAQLHHGQGSALYALASSGAIEGGLLDEIWNVSKDGTVDPIGRGWAEKLETYVMVRVQNGRFDAVDGWSHLWGGHGHE